MTEIVVAGGATESVGHVTITFPPEDRVATWSEPGRRLWRRFPALDLSPVVIQVPAFGERFWVYQVADCRTDGSLSLEDARPQRPAFYLLVGPTGRARFRRESRRSFGPRPTRVSLGRAFSWTTHRGLQAIQPVLRQIMMYPLSEYDGTMRAWTGQIPACPNPATGERK